MTWDTSVKGGTGTAAAPDGRAVGPAFAEMLSQLEITSAEQRKAAAQQLTLRENLRDRLTVVVDYLSGSYRRHTINRPLLDIDVLLVLSLVAYPQLRARTRESAAYALKLVRRALRAAYPGSQIITHDRCIQVQFVGTGIGFDVVPAVRFPEAGFEDEFWIPDVRLGRWVRTNPKAVERLMNEANARCGGRLVPLVKALKRWKDEHRVPLRGFQIEAMAYRALTSEPADDRQGIASLFGALATAVHLPIPDIWPKGENADAALSDADRRAAGVALTAAASAAGRAVRAETWGDSEAAHREWRFLFGCAYPERGDATPEPEPLSPLAAIGRVRDGARFSASSAGVLSAFAGYGAYSSPTNLGGAAGAPELDEAPVSPAHAGWLEADIAAALAQFRGLTRVAPATAAADPEMWPVGAWSVEGLHAVLIGHQRTNFGRMHRILVTVPKDSPAVESRVYLLGERALHRPAADGRFLPWRVPHHRWGDGALCTHAVRDRCDNRLVTLLSYAAEWLLRYDYHRMTGVWVGREIVARGVERRNGHRVGRGRASSAGRKHRRRRSG